MQLNPDFILYPHLPCMVGSPPVQAPVSHERDGVCEAGFYFFYCRLLFLLQILEVFVLCWQAEVFVTTIPKHSELPIAPMVHLPFVIDDDVKLASCRYSFYLLFFQRPDEFGLGVAILGAVAQCPCIVDEQSHEGVRLLPSVPAGVHFPILTQNNGVVLPTDGLLHFYVLAVEEFNQLWMLDSFTISMSQLPILIFSIGVQIPTYQQAYPDSPIIAV